MLGVQLIHNIVKAFFPQHNWRFEDQIYPVFSVQTLLSSWCNLKWSQIQNRQSECESTGWFKISLKLPALECDASDFTTVLLIIPRSLTPTTLHKI